MSHLPIEVLDNIFSYLHYEQKVNCMLVCRHWAHVLRTISLFHTLVIQPDDGFQNCKLLVQKLETEPLLSGQVRRLILFGGFNQYNVLSKLIELFPQLHVLYLRQIHVLRPDTTAAASRQQIRGWQHSLERLVERQTCVFSTGLLKLGVFHRLTELSLTQGDNEEMVDNIFELLKNAPALNQLELGGFDVSWDDLELLHKHVPLLVVLLLNSVKTPRERFNHRGSIAPASHLKTLTIQHCELGYDTQFHWIRYIVQKYPSLEHFTFSVRPILDQRHVDKDEYHERLVMPLINGLGTQLETFVLKPSLITPKLFAALDSKGCRLKKMDMDLLDTPELNESLFRSHQVTYLNTLTLAGADFKSFKPFKVFEHLKTLHLSFSEDHSQMIQDQNNITSIALNEVLADLPSQLEALTLIACAVRIEPFVSSYPSKLTSLTFEYAALDGQVSTFISDYCRRLKTLSLILCQPGLSTFYLPDHRLSCFEIFSHDTQSIFKLTIGNQTSYYQMNRVLFHGLKGIKKYFSIHDTPAFATRKPNIHSHQIVSHSQRPIIHLTCGSLSALYINTRLAI